MIAKLSDTSLSIWQADQLLQWSPVADDTDLDLVLANMGYTQQQDWTAQQDYLVTVVE